MSRLRRMWPMPMVSCEYRATRAFGRGPSAGRCGLAAAPLIECIIPGWLLIAAPDWGQANTLVPYGPGLPGGPLPVARQGLPVGLVAEQGEGLAADREEDRADGA